MSLAKIHNLDAAFRNQLVVVIEELHDRVTDLEQARDRIASQLENHVAMTLNPKPLSNTGHWRYCAERPAVKIRSIFFCNHGGYGPCIGRYTPDTDQWHIKINMLMPSLEPENWREVGAEKMQYLSQ